MRKLLEEVNAMIGRRTVPAAVTALIAILLVSSCASIPSEAPELSAELGNRISALEEANMRLLGSYFDLKRAEVDRFLEEEWKPLFAKNFFADDRMVEAWSALLLENDPGNRMRYFISVASKMQEKIDKKHKELHTPLDKLEQMIGERITKEYNQARAINNTLTSYLSSASEVEENRQKYMDMIGLTDETIMKTVDRIDLTVGDLVSVAGKLEKMEEEGAKYTDKIAEIDRKANEYFGKLENIAESLKN